MVCDKRTFSLFIVVITHFMILLGTFSIFSFCDAAVSLEPTFVVPTVNVTVTAGGLAILPCSIRNLGHYKVVWIRGFQVLTLGDRRVIDDDRFSVERPFTHDWNLYIRYVQYGDKGKYICKINTNPTKEKYVNLYVQEVLATEPSFDAPTLHVTVIEGGEATLPCFVDNLKEHKVVWRDQFSTILTFGTTRILDDDRITVERPYTEDWNLLIREVKYKDSGKYICQINTKPLKTQYVVLHVKVPPKVIDEHSTGDVITSEGDTVTLVCNVTGVPPPTVHWYRQPLGQSPGKQKENFLIGAPPGGILGPSISNNGGTFLSTTIFAV